MEQQENLLNKLQILPHNLLLIGPKYSGKKTLASEIISNSEDVFIWISEGSVDVIRNLSSEANYVFTDIDDWSEPCYAAMLLLLENTYKHIIITCKNIMNLPESIISRCNIETMEPYKNIRNYCDNIGQLEYYSDEMIDYIDKFKYNEKFDFDVFFSIACNRLLYQIKNGKDLTREYLITCKYNSAKNLKSLNKKQFILNWELDIKGLSNSWLSL